MSPSADAWKERYGNCHTPWDLGRAHPELEEWIRSSPVSVHGRALVPGCGTAFDGAALAQAGWKVLALDVVEEAPLAQNRKRIEQAGGEVSIEDALALERPQAFDLVFEHTFFCAIDPSRRGEWGELMVRSLAPGGELLALVFPADRPAELGGPPFGYEPADMLACLGEGFEVLADRPVQHPVGTRQWQERWLHCRRRY